MGRHRGRQGRAGVTADVMGVKHPVRFLTNSTTRKLPSSLIPVYSFILFNFESTASGESRQGARRRSQDKRTAISPKVLSSLSSDFEHADQHSLVWPCMSSCNKSREKNRGRSNKNVIFPHNALRCTTLYPSSESEETAVGAPLLHS